MTLVKKTLTERLAEARDIEHEKRLDKLTRILAGIDDNKAAKLKQLNAINESMNKLDEVRAEVLAAGDDTAGLTDEVISALEKKSKVTITPDDDDLTEDQKWNRNQYGIRSAQDYKNAYGRAPSVDARRKFGI